MKQLLEYIIPNIVNYPDEVKITEENSNGSVNLTIETNPEDVGRVIGKSGKVIKAIRQIARIIAIKQGVRVNIDVLDSNPSPRSDSANDLGSLDEDLQLEDINTDGEKEADSMPEEGIDLQTE